MTFKSKFCSVASLVLAMIAVARPVEAQSSPPAAAAQPDEAGSDAATRLGQLVVTANRAPTPADQVGQSVTVLTLADIRLDQETTVSDILARTPGVNFVRTGGPGQTTTLFIRGADSDHTVVLIDGVKVNDPSDVGAAYDFANLLTGDVARIEVLRGAQSTLYGSQAIGGVVNIVTAAPTKPLQGDLQVEGGSYGTAYANAALGGVFGALTFRLDAYYDTTDSVPAFDEAFGGRRNTGFHTAGASARLTYQLTPNLQLDERAYYTWSHAAFDGYDTPTGNFGDDSEFGRVKQLVDYTGLNLSSLDGALKTRLAFEYTSLDRIDEDPNQAVTKFTYLGRGVAKTVEYEGAYRLAPGYQLVFGATSEWTSINADDPLFDLYYGSTPTKAGANQSSGYVQATGEVLKGLTLTGGARYDAYSSFGGHATGQASAAYALNDGNTVLRASLGQGFKAPSLYQLYSEYGVSRLRPEQALSWDAGVEQHFLEGRLVLQGAYFGRTTRDLINFVSCYGVTTPTCVLYQNAGGYYQNVAKAQAQGVELQADFQATSRLKLAVNYTYDDDENRSASAGPVGGQLARRPKNLANLSATYTWPIKLVTSAALRYAGSSFNTNADTQLLKAYTLVDLRASYAVHSGLEVYARVENLADTHYETVYQYGTLGRAGYAGLRASF